MEEPKRVNVKKIASFVIKNCSFSNLFCCIFCCTWCPPVVKAQWSSIRFPFCNCLKYLCIIPRTWFPSTYIGNRVVIAKKRSKRHPTNHQSNTKYTFWTFWVHNILEQFALSHMNRYFLVLACFQLYAKWSPVSAYTTWVPLIFFASVTAVVALIDDCRRMFGDRKLNSRKVIRIDENGMEIRTSSKHLRVGDLVKIHTGEEIPADLVIIYSKNPTAYITTANLDGEVDLKPRPIPKVMYEYIKKIDDKNYDPSKDDSEEDVEDVEENGILMETRDDDDDDDDDTETNHKLEKEKTEEVEEEDDDDSCNSSEEEEEEEGEEENEGGNHIVVVGENDNNDDSSEVDSEDVELTESEEEKEEEEKETKKTIDKLYFDDTATSSRTIDLEDEEEESGKKGILNCCCRFLGRNDDDDDEEESNMSKRKLQFWPFVKHFEATITCPNPNAEIYEFNSSMSVKTKRRRRIKKKKKGDDDDEEKKRIDPLEKISLSADHLLFQSCTLKNTEWAIGVCVYSGNETKCGMNKGSVPAKRAKSDYFMDKIALAVFCFQMITSVIIFGATGIAYSLLDRREKTVDGKIVKTVWYLFLPSEIYPGLPENSGVMGVIDFVLYPFVIPVSMWLLTSYMIPISLKVIMDMMKFLYSIILMKDRDMYDPITKSSCGVRNTAIIEDLGQIEYILTDKTGTLTQNVMEFQKCSVLKDCYGAQGSPAMREEKLKKIVHLKNDEEEHINPHLMFFKALALCHTVSRETLEDGTVEFQSVSPDEVALVSAADEIGVKLMETREGESYTIKMTCEEEEEEKWEILRILKFNSDRKRMSVIVKIVGKDEDDPGTIYLFSKGADDVILERVVKDDEEMILCTEKHLSDFSKLGLRTLVVAYKTLDVEEWEVISRHLIDVDNVVGEERKEIQSKLYDTIEKDMFVLGTTAIEDKLQKEVQKTIWMMREAGIAVWMLTGDKLETAMQIGLSCNLLSVDQKKHIIRHAEDIDAEDEIELSKSISESIETARKYVEEHDGDLYSLIIEGKTLKFAFDHHRKKFRKLCLGAQTVVCARVTPGQKADIVRLVKKEGKMTLAIGDGGNDVPMIQEAHVGVGIIGREGLQASRSADFSFGQFRFLIPLIFVHGHYSLIRSGLVVQYSFYKNITLAFCQIMFNVLTRLSGQRPYNDQSLTLFNTWFTFFVPILVFDRTIDKHFLKNRPKLYQMSKDRTTYNCYSFALWFTVALLHGCICLFTVTISYSDNVVPSHSFSPSKQYFGIVLYSAILCTVNGTFVLFSNSYNACNCCVLSFILISYFVLLLIYNVSFFLTSIPGFSTLARLIGLNDDSEIFWVMMEQYRDPTAYFSVIFAVIVAILPLLVMKFIKYKCAPNIVEKFHRVEKRFFLHRKVRKNKTNKDDMDVREKNLLEIGGGYVTPKVEENFEEKIDEDLELEVYESEDLE